MLFKVVSLHWQGTYFLHHHRWNATHVKANLKICCATKDRGWWNSWCNVATNGKIEFESSPNQRTLKLIVKTLEGMFATESKTIASNVKYHFIEWPLGPLPPQCTGMAGVNCCAFGGRGSSTPRLDIWCQRDPPMHCCFSVGGAQWLTLGSSQPVVYQCLICCCTSLLCTLLNPYLSNSRN